jgi:hypothetical protein
MEKVRWTDEILDRVKELRKVPLEWGVIAERLGLADKKTLSSLRVTLSNQKAGRRNGRFELTRKEREYIETAVCSGKTLGEIASALAKARGKKLTHAFRSTVSNKMTSLGIDPEERNEWRKRGSTPEQEAKLKGLLKEVEEADTKYKNYIAVHGAYPPRKPKDANQARLP